MRSKVLRSAFFVILILLTACDTTKTSLQQEPVIISEKSFYKTSDVGTDVFTITKAAGNDHIFYQEPNYFNPQSFLFLFTSDRGDGKWRLYISNLTSGEVSLLRKSDLFGHIPTWSSDGKKIYLGEKAKIIAVELKTSTETKIKVPQDSWITFLHVNSAGDKILFIEEGMEEHKGLSIINTDGAGYRRLFSTDSETVFYLDHPTFINDDTILFLTRGKNRDFNGNYNQPYLLDLHEENGKLTRLPVECSHYDVNPQGDKILCASEGYIIDLTGRVLKNISRIKGHGAWAPDGDTFLMTGDPMPVPDGPSYGKIVIMKFSSNDSYNLVSHESTYDSSLEMHIQPNAQFSQDGKYVIYESDRGQMQNSDLYLVKVLE